MLDVKMRYVFNGKCACLRENFQLTILNNKDRFASILDIKILPSNTACLLSIGLSWLVTNTGKCGVLFDET